MNPQRHFTRISRQIEPRALQYLEPALNGDVEAASNLVFSAGNRTRGVLAVELWRARLNVSAYQIVLAKAWNHDHGHVIAAAKNRRSLRAMFRYAAFCMPNLPERVRVWRGSAAVTQRQASMGISWTLNRDVACWFALRFDAPKPIVLTAEISRAQISRFCNERNEREVVVFDVVNAEVDGHVVDWRDGQERRAEETRVRREAAQPADG